ncbi:MAG: hypothetical protein IJ138_06195 [Clostridia bacterium]|nr:hypothetical protein [Clostridia bacterium]
MYIKNPGNQLEPEFAPSAGGRIRLPAPKKHGEQGEAKNNDFSERKLLFHGRIPPPLDDISIVDFSIIRKTCKTAQKVKITQICLFTIRFSAYIIGLTKNIAEKSEKGILP